MATSFPAPIAIIGIGCRLPGGVISTESLWKLLVEGRNVWSEVPSERYNESAFYHPDPENNGTTNHRGGHFLSQDISAFDAAFFNISPVEASAMDPQQRLLLETTYEAFDNAGIPMEKARGSNTAVYAAIFTRDYDRNIYKDPNSVPKYHATGSGEAILSNRISYTFDLKGPSMTLDTGCSGSMVALHQACQSIRSGESNMALACGVNLILNPDHMFGMSNLHMLDDTGRSYSFDRRGNGYGRGEGVTAILIKRLDLALQAGDHVRAIIRNTAVNQDGKTPGITLPSQMAQEHLQRSIYQDAGLNPFDVSYIEAHGTGTTAGDLTEMKAISNVFRDHGQASGSLFVGSIKSNIGHLESSSGLAGLIKAVLILEKGFIPPNADFRTPKPNLKLDEWNIKVPVKLELLPGSVIRRVSVNNFGYGGTNAHAILEEAEARPTAPNDEPRYTDNDPSADGLHVIAATNAFQTQHEKEGETTAVKNVRFALSGGDMTVGAEVQELDRAIVPKLFVVSARSEKSIHKVAEHLKNWASTSIQQGDYLEDIAYTLSNRKSLMQWRHSFVADSLQDFMASLDENIYAKKILSDYLVGFVFTGQGGQWFAMGRDLMLKSSRFSKSLLRSDQLLRDLGAPWSLIEELLRDESSSRINDSEISQPATTCLQIALVDLLNDLGIRPEMVLGHSSGEIAAAYAAGVFPQAVAIKISYCRSFISNHCRLRVSSKGAMLAVGLGNEAVMPLIAKTRRGIVSVACLNSPSSTTVSGDEEAILELQETLTQLRIFNKRLKVDTAYHSHHMEKVAHDYLLSLDTIIAQVPRKNIRFMSSVTGLQKNTGFDQNYWVQNLTSKVYFHDALKEYCGTQVADSRSMTAHLTHILIEIGPHSVLAGPIHQTIRKSFDSFKYIYIPSLIRGRSALKSILDLSGKLFEQGLPIEVGAASSLSYLKRHHRVIHDLPAYPWDHSNTYWCESRLSHDYRLRKSPFHDLLGVRVPSSTSLEPSWSYVISVGRLPWLTDHIIDGLVIFPGAGYICMAIEAIRQFNHESKPSQIIQNFDLRDVSFLKALVIPPNPKTVDIRLSLRTPQNGTMKIYEFRISAISEDEGWHDHCQGLIKLEESSLKGELNEFNIGQSDTVPKDQLLDIMMPDCSKRLDSENIYSQLQSNGNLYGPCFAAIDELNIGDAMAIGHIRVPNVRSIMPLNYMQPHIIHPTTLDALMHTCLPLYTQRYGVGPVMPVFVGEMHISADISNSPGSMLLAATTIVYGGEESAKADILVFDFFGTKQEPVLTISDIEVHGFGTAKAAVAAAGWLGSRFTHNMSFQMAWGADVDYISSETNRSVASVSISHYLRQLCFKSSHMNVLQIGAQNGNTTVSILQTLSNTGTESVKCYDVTDTSPELYHHTRGLLKDWVNLVSFRKLDVEQDVVNQGFSASSYDLIIVTNVFRKESDLNNLTANAHKLLKEGGRLLFLAEESFPFSINQFNNTLMQHSFSGVELAIDEPQGFLRTGTSIVSRAIIADSQSPIYPIKIIATQGTEAFAHDIFVALKYRGFETSFTTWDMCFTESKTIYLILDSGMKPVLLNPPSEIFKQITKITNGSFNVFWISAHEYVSAAMNPEKGLVVGLARSARAENVNLKFITLDVRNTIDNCSPKLLHVIADMALVSFGISKEGDQIEELEFAYQDGQVLIPRLIPYQKMDDWILRSAGKPTVKKVTYGQPGRPLKLKAVGIGSVENAYFVDDESIQPCLDPPMIEVSVEAYCLRSTRDNIGFPAQTENSSLSVCEFAGTISAIGSRVSPSATFRVGDRVCGWSLNKACYASCVRVCSNHLAQVPNSMSLVIGATIPVPFMTAYYSLVEVAGLQRRQTILIHGAAGVMGEAALTLSLHLGARVFAIVSSLAERRDLVKRFNLSPTRIFLENTPGFKNFFFRSTFGNGADVIFIALASPDLTSDLWACIALLGVFIQIGRQADGRKGPIGISSLDRNATYVSIDLSTVMKCRPQKVTTLLAKAMTLFTAGTILPNERITTVPIQHLGDALKMIQSPRHPEFVVIEVEGNSQVNVLSTGRPMTQVDQFKLDADATYVIAGGLGDLGQKICRLIASRGAKNVVILSRRAPNHDRRREIQDELQATSPGLTIYCLACDISNKSMVDEVVAGFEKTGLPRVKGVIQAAAVLQDGVLERMNVHDFQLPLQAKVYGTRSLYQTFESSDLDFFIMLSSLSGTIGTRGQANYAAGNTFQDALANNQMSSKTHYISLNIGMVEGTSVYNDLNGKAREQNLLQHGLILVKSEELLAFLDYAISPQAREDPCRQAIIGIDGRSLYQAETATPTTRSGIFNHVRGAYNHKARSESTTSAESYQKAIANSQSPAELHRIIATAMVRKLSSLIALEDDKIDLESPLSEFGINSLIAIQLRSWITQEFHTKIESSEILDEQSIMALSLTVASRSTLTQQGSGEILKVEKNVRTSGEDERGIPYVLNVSLADRFQQHGNVAPKLPQLPLPSLESTLELYLASARPFLSENELIHTSNTIREFQEGIGPQMQQHLIDRSKNPQIDNWQHELQVNGIYLKRRDPIHPYGNFYGVHLQTKTPHSQSTRAAIISVATYNFKQRMDGGNLEQDYLHEQPLCMKSLQWLFNANRTPSVGIDKLHRYPGNNYLVALRRGHIFKVMLTKGGESATFASLKTTFEAILKNSDERVPAIATLTADERNSWARLRNTLKSRDEGNVTLMEMIEAAAFIVCLDDESPSTTTERCNNFLLGDPSNRWSDKSLQFAICRNGLSGYICEHSMLDALSLKQLNRFITKAILQHSSESQQQSSAIEVAENLSEEFTFERNEVIDAQIERIQKSFKKTHVPAEAAHFHLPTLGHSFLESHKISPKTAYQLIIQLASLLHFGQQFPSWEVLTLMPFHKGRLDWMQVVSPAMLAFCRAAAAAISIADNKIGLETSSELRMLLREAAMVHVRTMTRIARGRGFAAHMEALHEIVAQVLPDDDDVPALFRDQTWEKIIRVTNTRKIKTDASEGMMVQEGGFYMPDQESIFVHYEIEDEGGQFYIQTGSSQDCGTERFFRALEEAAGMFKRVLDI